MGGAVGCVAIGSGCGPAAIKRFEGRSGRDSSGGGGRVHYGIAVR